MPETKQQDLVSLTEMGTALGAPYSVVRTLVDRSGATISTRWDGSEAVTSDAAREIVEERRREVEEHDRLHRDYERYTREFGADRDRVFADARSAELARAHAKEMAAQQELHDEGTAPGQDYGKGWAAGGFPIDPRTSPQARARARAAARKAQAAWEHKHPMRSFEEYAKGKR